MLSKQFAYFEYVLYIFSYASAQIHMDFPTILPRTAPHRNVRLAISFTLKLRHRKRSVIVISNKFVRRSIEIANYYIYSNSICARKLNDISRSRYELCEGVCVCVWSSLLLLLTGCVVLFSPAPNANPFQVRAQTWTIKHQRQAAIMTRTHTHTHTCVWTLRTRAK